MNRKSMRKTSLSGDFNLTTPPDYPYEKDACKKRNWSECWCSIVMTILLLTLLSASLECLAQDAGANKSSQMNTDNSDIEPLPSDASSGSIKEEPIDQRNSPQHQSTEKSAGNAKEADGPVSDQPGIRPNQVEPGSAPGEPVKTDRFQTAQGVPLIIGGQEVFRIRVKLGPFTPELRIQAIETRLKGLEESSQFHAGNITTSESPYSSNIVAGDITILTVTDVDAAAAGAKSRQALAAEFAALLRAAVEKEITEQSIPNFLWRIALSLATTAGLIAVLSLINWCFPRLYKGFASLRGKYIRSVKFQQAVLLPEETVVTVGIGVFRIARLLLVLSLFAGYLTLVLSFFPQTKSVAYSIVHFILDPFIKVVLPAVISYLPNLVFIATITVCAYYVISFTRFVFSEIGRGTISFPSFDPEWADPTYKIARFLLIAFAGVLIFPYLPGSGSPAFQQISLFLGILVSLGSSGAIAHVIAGVFLTYTGAFKVGDRVRIADTTGDVVEKTLLATRIRTIKQEFITIPNGLVLGSHIVNYSSSATSSGLILHTTVTIGYDAPWKQVHQLLIAAAITTDGIIQNPAPFVLQTSLDDFYVSYQINAYTDKPHIMAVIYSQLHQNIQDAFNQAGVEIMSPHYSTLRDGNQTTIPGSYRGTAYKAPRFGLSLESPAFAAKE